MPRIQASSARVGRAGAAAVRLATPDCAQEVNEGINRCTAALRRGVHVSRGWERWAGRAARSVERRIDDARERLLGPRAARQVVPYRGYGTEREVFISGRVLANPPAPPVSADDQWWHNLANAFRHLETDEVPGARVTVRRAHAAREVLTDEEGFFRTWLPGIAPAGELWHDVAIDVTGPLHPAEAAVSATGSVIVPGPDAQYGVISDIDDTVIRTDATRLLRMLKRTLLDNARTRLPFEGVAEFYTALHDGTRTAVNPLFYVSSSPWNLYSVLTDFLEHQSIPHGPLVLRDWGIDERGLLPGGHGEHKLGAIRQILDCFPALPFILIGDSGQEDPEIYRDVVHEYGSRITAIYIRNVTPAAARASAIRSLAAEVSGAGSELLLSDDTLASARHAAARGWIQEQALERVAAAVSPSAERPG